jgi:hypothetical protein
MRISLRRLTAALGLLALCAADSQACVHSRRCRMPRWRPCGPCVNVRWAPCSTLPVCYLPPCESVIPGTLELLHMPEEDDLPFGSVFGVGLGGGAFGVPNLLGFLGPPGVVGGLLPLNPGDLTPDSPPAGVSPPPDMKPDKPIAVPCPASLGLALLGLACLLAKRGGRP